MSASPKMLPDITSLYDSSMQFIKGSSSTISNAYDINKSPVFYHQAWPNVSSTHNKQPPIPLPEISEFLREEKLKRSPSSLTAEDQSKSWNWKNYLGHSNDSAVPQNNTVNDNALTTTEKNQSKRVMKDCVSQEHDTRSPHNKRSRKNSVKLQSGNLPLKSDDQPTVTCAPTFSQLVSVDSSKLQTFNYCDYLTSPSQVFSDIQRDSYQSSSELNGKTNSFNNNNNANKNIQNENFPKMPSFTSLMFDETSVLPTFDHVPLHPNEVSEISPPPPPFAGCVPNHIPTDPMMYVNRDAKPISINAVKKNEGVCDENCERASNLSDERSITRDQKCNLLVKNAPLSTCAVKLERLDQNKTVSFFKHPTQNDLRELSWEDAKKHTQQTDYGHLQLQTSNSLLEDIDLTEVDNACMEQFERECQKEALQDMEYACKMLHIPTDASSWTKHQVNQWIMWTIRQCNLPFFDITPLRMSGAALCKLGEAEMLSKVPTCGDIIHARLRIWKTAAKILDSSKSNICRDDSKSFEHQTECNEERTKCPNEPQDEGDTDTAIKPAHASSIHLWMFLKELLQQPQRYNQFIRWIDKDKGVFKIENSVEVARLWGVRKNRPAMNYDKLSRSIRQYYKKGIIKKTTVSQRLVYQFVNPMLSMPI